MSDRLDEETERRVMDVMLGGYNSVSELRQRIRVLVSEARNIGYDNGFSDSRSLNSDPIPASLSIKANGS